MTWLEFNTMVREFLPTDSERLNVGTVTSGIDYVTRFIRAGIKDLQKFIDEYRSGHETTYTPDDLTEDGAASVGSLPADSDIRSARYVKTGNPVNSQPLVNYDWANRQDLVAGAIRMPGCQYALAIDPYAKTFMVYPAVKETRQVVLTWDGTKLNFADSDEVPFDEDAAEAVAEYVSAHIERKVNKDVMMFDSHLKSYSRKRALIYAAMRDKRRLKELAESQATPTCQTCSPTTQDDTTIEFAFFGDSGEQSTISDTEAVSQLVKTLDPDFVIHGGDASYPTADDVYLQDNLIKFYNGFIDAERFFLAMGNHDLDSGDVGAALFAALPYLADLNDGKFYYSKLIGNIEFFVLNSNLLSGGSVAVLADGAGTGSTQADWLTAQLAASGAAWKIVVLHTPPYTSDEEHTPGQPIWQLDYKGMGAHLMLCAHGHNYERLLVGGFPYLQCGLGGATKRGFATPVTGSQFRYNAKNGVIRIAASETRLQASFINTDNEVIDSLVLRKT